MTDHSESLFSTPQIWFSDPTGLNDPFECRPWFTFNGTQDQIVESLRRIIRRMDPFKTPDAATADAVAIYLEGRHRDPATWDNLRQDVLRMLATEIGLCCLSNAPDNILMWSHYGKDHTGFCIEFEATDRTCMFGAAEPVLYSEEFPVVDYYNTPKDKQVDLVFLTKYLGWAYEQEWRIIDHINGPGLREYPKELLKSVTFGLRMSAPDKAKIRTWISRREHEVKLFQASRHEHKFSIVVTEAH